MAKNLAELCPSVLWKVVHASCEIGYLTEIVSKVLKVQPGFSLLLIVKYKMREIN